MSEQKLLMIDKFKNYTIFILILLSLINSYYYVFNLNSNNHFLIKILQGYICFVILSTVSLSAIIVIDIIFNLSEQDSSDDWLYIYTSCVYTIPCIFV